MYSFTLSNIFYELNVLNENTFFLKPKISETNWFSSHFLLCYFASDSLQRYSLLSSLENLNLYQPSCILCVTLSHALLLGNLTGLLYFTRASKVPVPVMEGLDPIATLTDDATTTGWSNEGLPADRMSAENATIKTHCKCCFFMIDHQQEGIK